ncbi:MAG: hypothetical protein RTU92_04355 [Candidatus Thorarchaeota archaeon]
MNIRNNRDNSVSTERLREIAKEVLSKFGAKGKEMTPFLVQEKALELGLFEPCKVTHQELAGEMMRSILAQERIFYRHLKLKRFGLHQWRSYMPEELLPLLRQKVVFTNSGFERLVSENLVEELASKPRLVLQYLREDGIVVRMWPSIYRVLEPVEGELYNG